MKPGGGKSKGATFERSICKQLDTWWGEKDAFWRTPGSGARGTVSGAKHHFGDIAAQSNSTGHRLLDLVSIELKTGYGANWSPMDLLEGKPKTFFDFIEQADKDAQKAQRESFWLIFKQPRKQPYICMELSFYKKYWKRHKHNLAIFHFDLYKLVIMRLEDFFEYCPAENLFLYDN